MKAVQIQKKIDALDYQIQKHFPDGKIKIKLSESFQRSMSLKRHSVRLDPSLALEIERMMQENVVIDT